MTADSSGTRDATSAPSPVVIATRKSALALWQAEHVAGLLARKGIPSELLKVVTSGDKLQKTPLADVHLDTSAQDTSASPNASPLPPLRHLTTGKGLFVKEIQEAILRGEAHIAVHSMKDLPVETTPGMQVVCVLPRAPAPDVLVLSARLARELESVLASAAGRPSSTHGQGDPSNLRELDFETLRDALLRCPSFFSAPIGTTSARRQHLCRRHLAPNVETVTLRGNVDTRLRRLDEGAFSAILLAQAGLERLGLLDVARMVPLPIERFVPAPAQGVIAIEAAARLTTLGAKLGSLTDAETALAAGVERLVLALLGGDCHTPVGAHLAENGPNGPNGAQRAPRALHVYFARDGKETAFQLEIGNEELESLRALERESAGCYSRFAESLARSSFAARVSDALGQASGK